MNGARDLPIRQQTLWNTIDWSYRLLSPAQQQLFAELSVFVGGCTLAAVEAVCSGLGGGGGDVLAGVTALVDKSLLRQDVGPGDEPRFIMLETVREYASQQLATAAEGEQLRPRHAAYYLTLAECADTELLGSDVAAALDQLEVEHDNLRAAFGWFQTAGSAEMVLRLGGALLDFWARRGHMQEARGWLHAAFRMNAGRLALRPNFTLVKALMAAGIIELIDGDFSQAREFFQQAVAAARVSSAPAALAWALRNFGMAAAFQGDSAQAIVALEESIALCRGADDLAGLADALHIFGIAVREQGDHERAVGLFEESVALFRQLGSPMNLALVLRHLAASRLLQGNHAHATAIYFETLELAREFGDTLVITFCLEGLGWAAEVQGEPERAATLWGAADRRRTDGGAPLSPMLAHYHAESERRVYTLLGQQANTAARAAGYALSLEAAIAYALKDAPHSSTPASEVVVPAEARHPSDAAAMAKAAET